jgi:hypothetical protein
MAKRAAKVERALNKQALFKEIPVVDTVSQ